MGQGRGEGGKEPISMLFIFLGWLLSFLVLSSEG